MDSFPKNYSHTYLRFRIGNITYAVSANSKSMENVVKSYFYPYEPISDDDDLADVIFEIKSDTDMYSEAIKNFNAEISTWVISYCRTEEGTVRFIEYDSQNSRRMYRSQKSEFLLFEDPGMFTCIVPDDYHKSGKPGDDLFHVFEHVISKTQGVDGAALVHGASFLLNGRAFVAVGPKRSGKTTIFFDACLRYGARPIAVDKTYIRQSADGLVAYSHPSPLRVLPGTLLKYGSTFREFVPEAFRDAPAAVLWEGASAGKVRIPLRNFEHISGTTCVTSGPLHAFIFPQIGAEISDSFSASTDDLFQARFGEALFSPTNPEEDWWSEVGRSSADEQDIGIKALIRDLKRTPSYELSGADDLSDSFRKGILLVAEDILDFREVMKEH